MNIRVIVMATSLSVGSAIYPGLSWSQQVVPDGQAVQAFVTNPNTLIAQYPTDAGLRAATQALVMQAASSNTVDSVMGAIRTELLRPGANPSVVLSLSAGSNDAAQALVAGNQAEALAIRLALADPAVVAAMSAAQTALAATGVAAANPIANEVATAAITPVAAGNAPIGGPGSVPSVGFGGSGTGAGTTGGIASGSGTFTGALGTGGASITRITSSCVINVSADVRC